MRFTALSPRVYDRLAWCQRKRILKGQLRHEFAMVNVTLTMQAKESEVI